MSNEPGHNKILWTACGIFLVLLFLSDLGHGQIGLRALFHGDMVKDILLGVRLPKAITAILAGAALSVSGAQMQAIFRNPLADPHIMGVSAGAGTGAALATICSNALSPLASGMTVAAAAFIGAAIPAAIMILVSSKVKSGGTLLLFGVMLGFIFSAISSVLEYSANEESLKLFYSWSAGSFSGNRYSEIWILASAACLGTALAYFNHKGLDIILFGDEFAETSGASVMRVRLISILASCIATGAVTAFCGPIGFVGIIAPHIARFISKTSIHAKILPLCAVIGSVIALLADILSSLGGTVIPPGSTMALVGIPVIMMILLKNR